MQNLAHQAYGNVQARTASEKEIEQALMAEITAALEEIASQEKPALSDWYDAINRNLQMWTIFTTDLLNNNNPYPNELKAQLLYLAEFVRQQSRALFSNGAGDLNELIAINKILLGTQPPLTEVG